MATTLYLPSSGSAPLGSLAVDTNWELTDGLVRLPCFTTKQNTSLATSTRIWPATSTQQWCWWQFQSEQLMYTYDWTTSDTVSMVVGKCAETTTGGDTHLAYVVRVVSGDGLTIRGVVGLYHATSSEYPLVASAATRIHSARVGGATTFSSEAGDRIIVEIGLHGVTPLAQNIQMRIGDPSATGDFALTAGLTTDLCPWVRLSRDVVFGAPPIELVVQQVDSTTSEDVFVLSQAHNLVVAETSVSSVVGDTALTQVHNLTAQEVSASTISDDVILEVQSSIELVVQEVSSSFVADNVDVVQQYILGLDDVDTAFFADNLQLLQYHNIVVNDTFSSISTDDIVLVENYSLVVNSVCAGCLSELVTLIEHSVLVVDNANSIFLADNTSVNLPGLTKLFVRHNGQWVESAITVFVEQI